MISISLYPHQSLITMRIFFTMRSIVCVKWYLIVILSCSFLMANDVEHHFKCLLSIYIFPMKGVFLDTFHIFVKLRRLYHRIVSYLFIF